MIIDGINLREIPVIDKKVLIKECEINLLYEENSNKYK